MCIKILGVMLFLMVLSGCMSLEDNFVVNSYDFVKENIHSSPPENVYAYKRMPVGNKPAMDRVNRQIMGADYTISSNASPYGAYEQPAYGYSGYTQAMPGRVGY